MTAYWHMPTITLLLTLHFPSYLSHFFFFFYLLCFSCPFFHSFLFSLILPHLCIVKAFFYIARHDGFLLFCPLTTFVLCWSCHIPYPNKRVSFCFLAHRGIPIRTKVGILSYYPLWHAPSDSSSPFPFLGGMSSQQNISLKRA